MPSVQRDVLDDRRRDDVAQRGAGFVDQGDARDDGDLRGHARWFQAEVVNDRPADVERELFEANRAESGGLGLDRVRAGRNGEDAIPPLGVRADGALETDGSIGHPHHGVSHDRAGHVQDAPLNHRQRLGVSRRREQREQDDRTARARSVEFWLSRKSSLTAELYPLCHSDLIAAIGCTAAARRAEGTPAITATRKVVAAATE